MSDYHYRKEISGGVTYNEGSFIEAHDVYIRAEGEFILAPTFTAVGFQAETSADVISKSSATVVIDKLVADTVNLTSTGGATLVVRNLRCKTLKITVADRGTLRIEGGSIDRVDGSVEGSSTGVCRAKIGQDNVKVSGSSTWDTSR